MTLPPPMPIRAAVRALALTLACLLLTGAPARAAADRIVRVVAAPDEEFRGHPDWEGTLQRTVESVSDRMEIDFGLRLRVSRVIPWESGAPDYDMSALREELKRKVQPDGDEDIVIGFCGRETPTTERREMRLGQSDTPGRAIAVSDVAGRDLALVLRHELAHSFGVPHVTRVASIMNPDLRADHPDFDRSSAAILRNNLNLDFTSDDPFGGVRLEVLQSLYEEMARDGEYVADLVSTVGESFHARGQNDLADAAFQSALELDPELISPHLGLGNVALDEERYADAARELELVRTRQPRLAHLDMNLGLAYVGLDQKANATIAYQRAIKLDPRDVAAMNNLGLLYIDEQSWEPAETLLRRAITLVPDYAEAWNNLGMLYARTDRPQKAMDALTQALSLDQTALAHRNMAWVLLALGRRDEARAHLELARQLTADAAAAR